MTESVGSGEVERLETAILAGGWGVMQEIFLIHSRVWSLFCDNGELPKRKWLKKWPFSSGFCILAQLVFSLSLAKLPGASGYRCGSGKQLC